MASVKLLQQNGHNPALANGKQRDSSVSSSKSAPNGCTMAAKPSAQVDDDRNNNDSNNQNNNSNDYTANATTASSKSALALIEVRKKFLEYADRNPDKVNDRDKHKLATDDWYLKRYLLARNRRVNDTLDMLRKTMEWRNDYGIHISEDAMFPSEFYKIGALFPYECDKKGNLVLYLRIKYHRKIDEMVEVEKHFLVHTFEKIDRITNGQGLVIVFDCQGAGYANCDVEFLQFLISCATEHAPVGLQYIIVYKLPWVLNAFWSLARKLLPAYLANRVRFCDDKNITELIEPENLPDFMTGTCRRNYRWIPPGCPSVFKLANAHGITDAEISKILPQFQALLDEAEEAMNNSTYVDPPDTVTKYVNNTETASSLLSDLALCNIGLRPSGQTDSAQLDRGVPTGSVRQQQTTTSVDSSSIIKVFPFEFIEFNYDAFNDAFHGTVTIFNPSADKYLAFKLMSNRPSNYSVKPARGVLGPMASVTMSVVLLGEHKTSDKFLVVAQPLEGEITTLSKTQFDSLWSRNLNDTNQDSSHPSPVIKIELGTFLRKIHKTPSMQSTIKNPQLNDLVTTCRSLKRRQNLSIIINVILLIIIINFLLFE